MVEYNIMEMNKIKKYKRINLIKIKYKLFLMVMKMKIKKYKNNIKLAIKLIR